MTWRHIAAAGVLAIACLACTAPDESGLSGEGSDPAEGPRHVKVYFEKGMFGGWPANHGIWIWGEEILVGFGMGHYKDHGLRHHIDREKPEIPMLARSLDGGETWALEDPTADGYLITEGGYLHGVTRPGLTIPPLRESEGGIDFTHPDFALTIRTNSIHAGIGPGVLLLRPGALLGRPVPVARFRYTRNRPADRLHRRRPGHLHPVPSRRRSPTAGRAVPSASAPPTEERPGSSFPGSPPSRRRDSPSCPPRCGSAKPTSWWRFAITKVPAAGFPPTCPPITERPGSTSTTRSPTRASAIRRPCSGCVTAGSACSTAIGPSPTAFARCSAATAAGPGAIPSRSATTAPAATSVTSGAVQRPDGKVVAVYYYTDEASGPERYIGATIWSPPPK